jgi:hypothetical protein
MHPVIAYSTGALEDKRGTAKINFQLISCSHLDCPYCFTVALDDTNTTTKPSSGGEWHIAGLSIDAPEAVELRTCQAKVNKLKRLRRFMQ